ncbi:MAG: alpha/beta fold hydrolase [Balneolaceae bacterium]
MRILITFIVIISTGWTSFAQSGLDTLSLKDIFLEPVLPGIRPAFSAFSPDMKEIYFSWNDSAYFETGFYKTDLRGSKPEKLDEDAVRIYTFSPDMKLIVYTKDGNIYVSDPQFKNPGSIVSTQSNEFNPTWSPDSKQIAFIRDGDLWITDVTKPDVRQITKKGDYDPNYSIVDWSGTDKLILQQSDNSDARTIYFPEYIDTFVKPGASTRGIPVTTITSVRLDSIVIDTLNHGRYRSSTSVSNSGRYLAIDQADDALKYRKIIVHDFQSDTETVVFEDSTTGWLHNRNMQFAPNSDVLMFQSERDNWNHIYTIKPDGSNLKQHTSGNFDIPWAQWLDDNSIIYASTEEDLGERHLYILNIQNNRIQKLTSDEAYRYQFRLSPDNRYVVYAKTFFNEPYDLYLIDLKRPRRGEIRLTNSVPALFREIGWQREEYIRFTGRDGETELSMSVLKPVNFNPQIKYPVVVFVHGAGSLQNVYKGWSNNYWREYMFHQFLNQHGYVVVEVDYRHSTGYGRKFREDVTNWMGKFETEDMIDGLDWLDENGGYLDLDRVGVYGGSYGGFMALYAVSVAPERFHAAAALRAVTNWENYFYANPWYTLPRLGTPEDDREHFDRSSPLTYASEVTRPVYILHGLVDDNVGFQDAAQYIEELIQSGNKDFEMMMYPSEPHGFTSPGSWYDEYRRIFNFFEKHLK